jgi:hypothetical protein
MPENAPGFDVATVENRCAVDTQKAEFVPELMRVE